MDEKKSNWHTHKRIFIDLCMQSLVGGGTVGSRGSKHDIRSLPFLLRSLGLTLFCVGFIFWWVFFHIVATGSSRLIISTGGLGENSLSFPVVPV